MNRNQKVLLKCLRAGMIGESVILQEEEKNVSWQEVIKLAKDHSIESLVYISIAKVYKDLGIEFEAMDELLKNTINNNLYQISLINMIRKVVTKLKEEGIKPILLKGAFLRNYYSLSEARTMGDGDILVKREEYDRAIEVIKDLGFQEICTAGIHGTYIKGDRYIVEIHWELVNNECFKKENTFENYLWDNIIDKDFNGEEVYSLGYTDFFSFLCVHTAMHKIYHGFGVRFLSDIVLFYEKEKENIDIERFKDNMEVLGLTKYTKVLFLICYTLLGAKEIQDIYNYEAEDEDRIDEFIQFILDGEVHGKAEGRDFLAREKHMALFARQEDLKDRYSYAKRYKILLPIAWIHRIINGITNRDFSLKDKLQYYTKIKKERNKLKRLDNWLEI